jgi:hypothetical protein
LKTKYNRDKAKAKNMTKKDYELIAGAIRFAIIEYENPPNDIRYKYAMDYLIIKELCKALKRKDKKFDEIKFKKIINN